MTKCPPPQPPTCCSIQNNCKADCTGLSLLRPNHLIRKTPAWILGCWQAVSVWCVLPLALTRHSPGCQGEHCALCWWGRQANGSHFQQKQEVRIGGFLLPGPLLSFKSYMEPNSNHVCSCPVDLWAQPSWLPGWLVGKGYGLPNNIWFQETFFPSFFPLLFEFPPFCKSTGVSLGKW